MANYKLNQTGEQIQNALNLIDSNAATSGQVLTADGNGGASWQDASGGGGGGVSIDLSSLFTISAPQFNTGTIIFNCYKNNVLYPSYYESNSDANYICSAIIISNLQGAKIESINGNLIAYDGTKITPSNINSYFGKLLILKSNVTIWGEFQ